MIYTYDSEKQRVVNHQTKVSETLKNMFQNLELKFDAVIEHQVGSQNRPRNRRFVKRKDSVRCQPPLLGNSRFDIWTVYILFI